MSVDLEQQQRLLRIGTELEEATKTVKTLTQAKTDLVADLPEYQALQEALTTVKACRERLKLALRDNHDLNRLEAELGEARYLKKDLIEMYSHHLVVYRDETGRDVVKDKDGRTYPIEVHARRGKKPTLDQPRLPLGINRHLGQRQPIPEGIRIEREGR